MLLIPFFLLKAPCLGKQEKKESKRWMREGTRKSSNSETIPINIGSRSFLSGEVPAINGVLGEGARCSKAPCETDGDLADWGWAVDDFVENH